MKLKILIILLLVTTINTMTSCSSDTSDTSVSPVTDSFSTQKTVNYSYNSSEIETMNLINTYRVSIGLNPLEKINYISSESEEHDNYMIVNDVVNHDGFVTRSENIMRVLGAKSVSENIAFNYNTSQAVLNAWLASPAHKENIEGNFTHFGISIRVSPATGRKYYTNIFAKI